MNDAELITPEALAAQLGVDVQTLCNWRSTKRYALPFIKCGRLVRYRRSDVNEFLKSRTVTPLATGTGE